MFQGTGSGVGKSVLAAGFCRLIKNRGMKVLPFKSQNMALNSGVTPDGLEMGRAQIVQAEACGVFPDVRMNPILLKPQGLGVSQLIRLGKVIGKYSAREYYELSEENFGIVKKTFDSLKLEADWIVIEGAGSPAEINLQDTDIVNMKMAEYAKAKVILVGDIDRGGVFAWLKGTFDLIQEQHRSLLHGMLINKFRGDVSLLDPGIKQFSKIVPIPLLGVIPWRDVKLEDEDSQNIKSQIVLDPILDIAVIRLPHISNFTDFEPLKHIKGISIRFINNVSELVSADLIIIPGSKNTLFDMGFLKDNGFYEILKNLSGKTWIMGICGGFQMLGECVADPDNHEIGGEMSGLSLFPLSTRLLGDKKLVRRAYKGENLLKGLSWTGYEIHLGRSVFNVEPKESLVEKDPTLGVIDRDKKLIGTYIHGWFDNHKVSEKILSLILGKNINIPVSFNEIKNQEMNELAFFFEKHCDIDKILQF